MADLIPIPLNKLTPITLKPAQKGLLTTTKPKPASTALIPAEQVPEGPKPEEISAEFDALSIKMRLHHNGEQPMDDQTYKTTLRRSIDLISMMNQTTAGPKAKNKKIGVEKQAPKSLADL